MRALIDNILKPFFIAPFKFKIYSSNVKRPCAGVAIKSCDRVLRGTVNEPCAGNAICLSLQVVWCTVFALGSQNCECVVCEL